MIAPMDHGACERALACFRRCELDETAALCQDALSVDPNRLDALGLAIAVAVERGELAQAEQLSARASRLAPTAPLVHLNRAEVLRQLGRVDESVEAFERAVALDRSGPALLGLGSEAEGVERLGPLGERLDRRLQHVASFLEPAPLPWHHHHL